MLVVAVVVQAFLDFGAVVHRDFHALGVHAGAVSFALVEEFGLDPDRGKDRLDVDFVVAGVARVASEGIRHHGDREAQVLFEDFLVRHVDRYLAEDVVIVPGIDEADLFAARAQGPHDEVDRYDFAEIADMHGSGGRNSRSAGIQVQVAPLADYLVGGLVRPMGELCIFHSLKSISKKKTGF